jgi:RimJ/RimL family protein N-acetyltransferase
VVPAIVATTERLQLTSWTDDDLEPLAALHTVEVVRYTGGIPWTIETGRAAMAVWQDTQERYGITTWAARSRRTDELVGRVGFVGMDVNWLRSGLPDMGWTFAQGWWHHGLASEAARAALALALVCYPAERIVAKCHIDNAPSEAVARRIGMRRVGVVHGGWDAATVICRLG